MKGIGDIMSHLTVRNNNGLSADTMLKMCPSIFAESKHESRSDRYSYVSTIEILKNMIKEGLVPVKVTQSKSRIPGKEEYTKHMIRLRERDKVGFIVGEEVQELILINSHDGTSAYELIDGIYRTVCTNGLVTCIENRGSYKVLHKGNIHDGIIGAAYKIINDGKETMRTIGEMKHIELSRPEQLLLSEFAIEAKYGIDEEKREELPFTPDNFLMIRRYEDKKPDLYTTFNVIEENMIKGGVTTRDRNYKRHTTRVVNSIDGDVKLNKLLWQLANKFMELKTA